MTDGCGTCIHRFGFLTKQRQCSHSEAAYGGAIPSEGRPSWCPGYVSDGARVVGAPHPKKASSMRSVNSSEPKAGAMTKEEIDAIEKRAKDGLASAWVFGPDAARDTLALIAEVREAGARELEAVADLADLPTADPRCLTVVLGWQKPPVGLVEWLRSRAASLRKDAR